MLFQTLTSLTLATLALAAPQGEPTSFQTPGPPAFGDKFGIAATGKGIINKDLTASKGRIFIGGKQNPSCDRNERQDFATFVLYSDSTVFLYKTDNPPQQLWVDASGMGQGISGYTTGAQPAPSKASREGFKVDQKTGELRFGDVGAKACPTQEEGKWSVWFTSNEKPGFQDGCVDVQLKAYKADARVGCTYTSAD